MRWKRQACITNMTTTADVLCLSLKIFTWTAYADACISSLKRSIRLAPKDSLNEVNLLLLFTFLLLLLLLKLLSREGYRPKYSKRNVSYFKVIFKRLKDRQRETKRHSFWR